MNDLRVERWRRYGHDRIYVNSASAGTAVAWYDCKNDRLTVVDETYRVDVEVLLAPYLPERPRSTPKPPTLATFIATAQAESGRDLARNRPGDALRSKIAEVEPRALSRLLARWLTSTDAHSWAVGLHGEKVTGARLDRLTRRGWHVLHSIELPSGADIDHLAIGPAGVFVINTKHHRGKSVWQGDHAITVNGTVTRYRPVSLSEAERAARTLSGACGFPVSVRAVLAVVGATKISVKTVVPDVILLDGARIDQRLSALSTVIPAEQVERIYAAARKSQTWRP